MKSNYPDWVLSHKPKGVYVNKVGDTYYLYKAHCVYDKTTGKKIRVSDGNIGRVTEKDGFIPVKDKVRGGIVVYEYGLYLFLSTLLKDTYKSLKSSFKTYSDSIVSLALLSFSTFDYIDTGLFYIYKKTNPNHFLKEEVIQQAERVKSMIEHFLTTRVSSEDWSELQKLLPIIHLVKVNDKLYVSKSDNNLVLDSLLSKYNVEEA